jgi:hypothetical protein
LLEKLTNPRKSITAHVYRAPAPAGEVHALDPWAAGALRQADLTVKIFLPLPVLGVPGWWAQNEALSFYDDQLVFRPAPTA